MNITEAFQVYVIETTPADGRWLLFEADPTAGVSIQVTARSEPCGVPELRKLRAIINHFIEAPEVTEASVQAAIAAEFEE
jgi:hypothetical protein